MTNPFKLTLEKIWEKFKPSRLCLVPVVVILVTQTLLASPSENLTSQNINNVTTLTNSSYIIHDTVTESALETDSTQVHTTQKYTYDLHQTQTKSEKTYSGISPKIHESIYTNENGRKNVDIKLHTDSLHLNKKDLFHFSDEKHKKTGDVDVQEDDSSDEDPFQTDERMQNDLPTIKLKRASGRGNKASGSRSDRRNKYRYKEPLQKRKKKEDTEGMFSNEYRIKRMLLNEDYDKTTRPVRNDSTTVTVHVGMSLYHILDTNEKMQTLSALIAIRLRWTDEYLTWDSTQFGGVDTIWLPAMQIWTPDIFISNFADDSFQDFMDTFAIVGSDGQVLWMFPAVIKTYCTLDVQHFPFDQQKCDVVFISWTFNGFKVNITYNATESAAIYYKPKNQEWFVDKMEAQRHEKVYVCCDDPYPDVTFTIFMTRRSLFYIINLIFPCLLIYTVSFLGFYLPAESGEKVNLEITILLALVVFLLMVGETLPPTPDAIPALGLLFGTTMIMVSIALVMAVIVTNLYLRKDSGKRVPYIVRKIFLAKSDTAKTGELREPPTRKVSNNHVDNNHQSYHNDIKYCVQEMEMDNISQLSEQDNAICTSRCRRRRSNQPVYRGCDVEYSAMTAGEWLHLARTVDRLCFWLFLFSSVAALVAIFAQIPNFSIVQ